jgi:hypothetical protein
MMSSSKVFGPKGLVESRRQRVRGVSRYIGDKIIEDGLHAGRFEPWSKATTRPWTLSSGRFTKGILPSPSLEGGLKAQLLAYKAIESLENGQPVKFAKETKRIRN